ncbi:hypothetical protein ILFOPFJJ_04920 [Ensifer psoraleae]|uniref:hypothetical protein n=1 Tax=Sinorhizobium psoraleae TaxID=520838 RepID=UPI0015684193|nr:hypothetical protein [Sinorhizobium psoraleae]NRP73999.1 hypothetical protein [Sinorhizobium psoraleae]
MVAAQTEMVSHAFPVGQGTGDSERGNKQLNSFALRGAMLFRSFIAARVALVALTFAALTFAAPAFAAPDRLLDALLSCKPEFFSVLKEERAALGPVRIDFDEGESNSPHGPPRENYYKQMAIFAKPIAIGGFPIIGYSQDYSVRKGEALSWYNVWLHVAWPRDKVVQALEARTGITFEESRYYDWRSNEAREDGRVSPEFAVSEMDTPEGQSILICDSVGANDTEVLRLPDITELFGAPELGPLPLGDADRLMKGLLSCTPEFFDLLKAEQEAFGAVQISRISRWGKSSDPIETRVKFQSIVHAWGLDLTGYVQRVDRSGGREKISWGFETAEWVLKLEHTIAKRTGSVHVEGQGWMLNLPTEATGYTPSQSFAIGDAGIEEGGLLFCSFSSGDFPAAALPEPSDLFLTAAR